MLHATDWSRRKKNVLALVLAGGSGTRLLGLTRDRAKPAVPFGGHHKIIDYALSNCAHSGLLNTAVLTQYKSQSLIRHLQHNWLTVPSAHAGSFEIWPAQQRNGTGWYAGTADAVHQNRDLIESHDPDNVIILAGDHIYRMDYSQMLATHAASGSAATICCTPVPASQSHRFGIVELDRKQGIRAFAEKPNFPAQRADGSTSVLASMGIYIFNTQYLLDCLEQDARDPESGHDFGYDILPRVIGDGAVGAHLFRESNGAPGYWRDVGTLDSYWAAHQEILNREHTAEEQHWPLFGNERNCLPARLYPSAGVTASIVGAGSSIGGRVDRSVVSARCHVGDKAVVSESVLLPGARVGRNCRLNRVIVDSDCEIPDDVVIGARYLNDSEGFHVTPEGITLVTDEALSQYVQDETCAQQDEPERLTA